jgi:shikimate kinase
MLIHKRVLKEFQEYNALATETIKKGEKKRRYLKNAESVYLYLKKEKVMAHMSINPKIPSIQNRSMLKKNRGK